MKLMHVGVEGEQGRESESLEDDDHAIVDSAVEVTVEEVHVNNAKVSSITSGFERT